MAIKEERPVSMSEVFELVNDEEKGKKIREFIKGFGAMKIKDAENMMNDLRGLKIMKLKESHIIKVVDFKPIDATELNKVLSETSLDSDEVSKILDVVSKY